MLLSHMHVFGGHVLKTCGPNDVYGGLMPANCGFNEVMVPDCDVQNRSSRYKS